MSGPQISWLPDGRRLHMNHGPIDLIVEAWGEAGEVRAAYEQAAERFRSILEELVSELPGLRKPARSLGGSAARGDGKLFHGPTARRMALAVAPFAEKFITPMAAVAGAVADEMLAAMLGGRVLDKAYVNDGGDIALHLARGHNLTLAVAGAGHALSDQLAVEHGDPVRGVATSGWRGRSFSLGIADAVTVLAADGASADAAATIIANAVDLPEHQAISRAPANSLQPDTDLGGRLVTTGVGRLSASEVDEALARGLAVAQDLRRRGLIVSAGLFLAGQARIADGSACLFHRDTAVPAASRLTSGFSAPGQLL